MNQLSLTDVGIDKVEQWLELENVYGVPVFHNFFRVLSDSMMLIDWLREETHGMLVCDYDCIKYQVITILLKLD